MKLDKQETTYGSYFSIVGSVVVAVVFLQL